MMPTPVIGASARWTHKSVKLFAPGRDPVDEMIQRSQALALRAIEGGWHGPPYDPIGLAEVLKIPVIPRDDVADARTVPVRSGEIRIEYNPTRPLARLRYSIAHEIAHTLFPDCEERMRHRQHRDEMRLDDWQLEMLCNVGAAELLMPIGSLADQDRSALNIDSVLELRKRYQVSTEAILLRLVRLTSVPCVAFAASRTETAKTPEAYVVDYAILSPTWTLPNPRQRQLPHQSVIGQCTGIGYTAKGHESWPGISEKIRVECVGVQPYPERMYPRVVGVALAETKAAAADPIEYVKGDATVPRGVGARIVAHVVTDKTPNWGAGFARVVRNKWPLVQQEFQTWVDEHRPEFTLGNVKFTSVSNEITICHMIAQRGYGAAKSATIRYGALRACLEKLADFASKHSRTVHMPRVGCGEAGGSWAIVEELIIETLGRIGVPVTIYDLPGKEFKGDKVGQLFPERRGGE